MKRLTSFQTPELKTCICASKIVGRLYSAFLERLHERDHIAAGNQYDLQFLGPWGFYHFSSQTFDNFLSFKFPRDLALTGSVSGKPIPRTSPVVLADQRRRLEFGVHYFLNVNGDELEQGDECRCHRGRELLFNHQ